MIPHQAFVVTLTLISAVSIGLVACSGNSSSGAGGPAAFSAVAATSATGVWAVGS